MCDPYFFNIKTLKSFGIIHFRIKVYQSISKSIKCDNKVNIHRRNIHQCDKTSQNFDSKMNYAKALSYSGELAFSWCAYRFDFLLGITFSK